mmetsp:Transcript_39104/g.111970  ORF Transcript_39104/g.111970 Transcript_39104/m.111970 type:complete len:282 (-) Transcript_39104:2-847(-)
MRRVAPCLGPHSLVHAQVCSRPQSDHGQVLWKGNLLDARDLLQHLSQLGVRAAAEYNLQLVVECRIHHPPFWVGQVQVLWHRQPRWALQGELIASAAQGWRHLVRRGCDPPRLVAVAGVHQRRRALRPKAPLFAPHAAPPPVGRSHRCRRGAAVRASPVLDRALVVVRHQRICQEVALAPAHPGQRGAEQGQRLAGARGALQYAHAAALQGAVDLPHEGKLHRIGREREAKVLADLLSSGITSGRCAGGRHDPLPRRATHGGPHAARAASRGLLRGRAESA